MDSVLIENDNVTSTGGIIAIATVVILEMIVSLIINSFILIFTVTHFKILKNPGIIFLTNFIIANLFLALVYMPSVAVSAIGGEWVYGSSQKVKYGSCQFIGFVLSSYGLNVTYTITIISVDRFLLIVKPFLHKRYMNAQVAMVILAISWILSCGVSIPPLARYQYAVYFPSCVPQWDDNTAVMAIVYLPTLVCIIVIAVTTIWTLCFTMKFVQRSGLPTATTSCDNNLYNKRMCKIIGMFGSLLIVTITSYVPAFLFAIIEVIMKSDNELPVSHPIVTMSFLSLAIVNPAIQLYFRKELSDFLKTHLTKLWDTLCQKATKLETTSSQRTDHSSNGHQQ